MLYTRHVDTSATISAAKYLLLRPPQAHGERLALLWTQGENGGVRFRSELVYAARVPVRVAVYVTKPHYFLRLYRVHVCQMQ